jgi:hypothetical protein
VSSSADVRLSNPGGLGGGEDPGADNNR